MPLESMHEAACFVDLYEYIQERNIPVLVDLGQFRSLLQQQISKSIDYRTDTWNIDYVCKPSQFISNP